MDIAGLMELEDSSRYLILGYACFARHDGILLPKKCVD